jgi:membrane-associated phospholipid phosphatase
MSPGSAHARIDSGTTRNLIVASSVFVFVVVEGVVVYSLLYREGLRLSVRPMLLHSFLGLAPTIAAGIGVHALVSRFRDRDWSYLRVIFTLRWMGFLLLLLASVVGVMFFYTGLKTFLPLLTGRETDQVLWDMDRVLFFGMSPNIFFVNLFDHSLLLRFIDFGYGYFFFTAVLLSVPIFFSLRDERMRVSFVAANVMLWSAGAWLYFAAPSLGPAYRFSEVWDAVRAQFPVSTFWQKQLIQNYELVLKIRDEGVVSPDLNIFAGIGAFPSLHVAFQTLFALYLGRLSRHLAFFGWLLVALTFLGSVLTGWHYLIDSIAGALIAAACFIAFERMLLRPERFGAAPAPDLQRR